MKRQLSGAVRFFVTVVTLLVIVIGAIEWSRQVRTAETSVSASSSLESCSFPREIRDAAGETLVIADTPRRIVSQTLGTDEILLAICPAERIVALSSLAEDDNYSNVVEEARRVPDRTTLGAEQILQLEPDLIFVASYSRAETVELLKASRAPVFRFANFDSIADVQNNIRTVGYAVGCDAEAEALVHLMDDTLAAVRARIPQNQPAPRVLSFGMGGYTAGSKTTFHDMLRAVGAVNCSAEHGIEGFSTISVEQIIAWQPDFIVTGANHGEMESVRNQLLADPVIAVSQAGRAGRIIVMDNKHFLTVSQYVVRGIEDLADGLYGKRP